MQDLPERYTKFRNEYPSVAEKYESLGKELKEAGPLDAKTAALVKLGIAIGAGLEGSVHSQTRKALDAGASSAEIKQCALLAITGIGFPSSMAALSWVEDILEN